jgi:hypothetical protein
VNQEAQIGAHLSAMFCNYGPPKFYDQKLALLGPDPLREDADKELVWKKMQVRQGIPNRLPPDVTKLPPWKRGLTSTGAQKIQPARIWNCYAEIITLKLMLLGCQVVPPADVSGIRTLPRYESG